MTYAPPSKGYPYQPLVKNPHPAWVSLLVTLVIFLILSVCIVSGFFLLKGAGSFFSGMFGECSTTPKVAAVVEEEMAQKSYDLVSVSYECNRGPSATVTSDIATLYLSMPGSFTSSDDVIRTGTQSVMDSGWTKQTPSDNSETNVDILTKDGYSITVDAHSYDPALLQLSISRDDVEPSSETTWDTLQKQLETQPFTQDDINTYALLPDYAPQYLPENFKPWESQYNITTEYYYKAEFADNPSSISLRVVQAPESLCDIEGRCTMIAKLDNGLKLMKVHRTGPSGSLPGGIYNDNTYVLEINDVDISYAESDWFDNGTTYELEPLTEDQIIAIFNSIDARAVAPAR